MKTTLSLSPAAQLETECLVAVVLDPAEKDRGEKDKIEAFVSADRAVQQAAADLISSGDLTGKSFETAWLHRPTGLEAKRLLLIGGGKAKSFSVNELRKLAGAAVRALKPRTLRSLAFVIPERTANTLILLSLFGNPVDLARVSSLLSLSDPSIFGAAGAALLKFLGGPGWSYAALAIALTTWLIGPVFLAARILRRIDL